MRIHKIDLLYPHSRVVDAKFKTPKRRLGRSATHSINTKNNRLFTASSVHDSALGAQTGFYLPEDRLQERVVGP
jgi:hypothetical protein